MLSSRGARPCRALSSRGARPCRATRIAVPADSSGPGQTEVPRNDKDKPYKQPSPEPLDFRGPGREEPEPDVDEVVLGWFGPGDPDHPDFGDLWRGATLALEQENAAGGYRGKPFRILPAWSENPWKAGIVDLTRLVYDRGAWAVIGGVDGTTTHLAVQIALKSHFLLLSPGSTDASADHANVPWLFSLPPSDERIAPVLADAIARAAAGARLPWWPPPTTTPTRRSSNCAAPWASDASRRRRSSSLRRWRPICPRSPPGSCATARGPSSSWRRPASRATWPWLFARQASAGRSSAEPRLLALLSGARRAPRPKA